MTVALMRKTIRYMYIIAIGLSLISCGKNFKIDKSDHSLIPYKGTEILVFKSSEQRQDTMFLMGYENYSGPFGPMELFPDKHEVYRIKTKRSDPNYDRYLDGKSLIELTAGGDGTTIWFDIAMKGSWFYGKSIYSKAAFDSVPITKLTIENKIYDDVKVFQSDGSYEQRDNYSERFYWSLSEGFLGIDRRNEKWRLIKKYVP
jgi:hypothetical protein